MHLREGGARRADLLGVQVEGHGPRHRSGATARHRLTSEGAGCPDPKGGKGASYWGYSRSGDNIIVHVETAIKDRPVAGGAVIPKPFGSGEVFLAPKGGAPYGKPVSGKGSCKVGNPGKPRTVPVSNDELGEVYSVAESDF
jgi:hypothetical protein